MAKQITVFSKDNCMQCNFTKNFLSDKGIKFKVRDCDNEPEALEEVKALGFSTLPVVVAEGLEPFFGFRPEVLSQLG